MGYFLHSLYKSLHSCKKHIKEFIMYKLFRYCMLFILTMYLLTLSDGARPRKALRKMNRRLKKLEVNKYTAMYNYQTVFR